MLEEAPHVVVAENPVAQLEHDHVRVLRRELGQDGAGVRRQVLDARRRGKAAVEKRQRGEGAVVFHVEGVLQRAPRPRAWPRRRGCPAWANRLTISEAAPVLPALMQVPATTTSGGHSGRSSRGGSAFWAMLAGLPSRRTDPRTSTSRGEPTSGFLPMQTPEHPSEVQDVDRVARRGSTPGCVPTKPFSARRYPSVPAITSPLLIFAIRPGRQLQPVVNALLHQGAHRQDVSLLRLDVRRDLDLPREIEARRRGSDLVQSDRSSSTSFPARTQRHAREREGLADALAPRRATDTRSPRRSARQTRA